MCLLPLLGASEHFCILRHSCLDPYSSRVLHQRLGLCNLSDSVPGTVFEERIRGRCLLHTLRTTIDIKSSILQPTL